jgi:glucokinase
MAEGTMLLVGDIGGTQSRFALLRAGSGSAVAAREATFPSRDYAGLEPLVAEFMRGERSVVGRAVLAVAGPVVGGRAILSNLPWELDEARLGGTLGVGPVCLINDLFAMAYAIPHIAPEALHTLQPGIPVPGGAITVVAPGTGLGEAFLTWDRTRYRAHASEGGHADFGPTTPLQLELLRWLQARGGHVSYERVCSGRGLPEIYRFLREHKVATETAWVAERLTTATDPTPVIVEAAIHPTAPCALALAAVQLVAEVLAAEAANAALRVLATGGVYLGGGLPRRLLGVLTLPTFVERFRMKGRLAPLLEHMPLHVLTRPNIALLGAVRFAVDSEAADAPDRSMA